MSHQAPVKMPVNLEKTRDELKASMQQLNWANDKAEDLSIKKLTKDSEDRNKQLFLDALDTYLGETKQLAVSSAEVQAKQLENTKRYSDGLIDKGGVSTDVFKKALGEEKTRDFFDKVFFGTAHYSG